MNYQSGAVLNIRTIRDFIDILDKNGIEKRFCLLFQILKKNNEKKCLKISMT